MKRQQRRIIKQYIFILLFFISTVVAVLVIIGHKGSVIKTLSIIFIAFIGLFAGLSAVDLMQEPANTEPGFIEVEQESIGATQDSLGNPDDNLYFVDYVIDGDTIKVRGTMRVRLIGIDAPESGECYYEEASVALDELIGERYVRLERDINAVDDHGRLLRYVFLPSNDLMEDDIFINAYMLRRGSAKTLLQSPNNRHDKYFISAREEALMQRRGLWDECEDILSNYEKDTLNRERHEPPTDPNCIIKGNISTGGIGKTYTFPGCSNYGQVKIDTRKGEQYFCTEEQAQKAGFNKSGSCK